ncbi:MAG: hypothetical protein HY676_05765 [Chloroflexi bacterium]|nr:hypothetical protein [Chloroflexota bacterium]
MIVARTVFQAKYGKANELVAHLKKAQDVFVKYGYPKGRVLTDLSGNMFTIVWENDWESLAAWDVSRSKVFSVPEFRPWFAEMEKLVESGSREFYSVE